MAHRLVKRGFLDNESLVILEKLYQKVGKREEDIWNEVWEDNTPIQLGKQESIDILPRRFLFLYHSFDLTATATEEELTPCWG